MNEHDEIHNHPTIQRLLATAKLHRVMLGLVSVVALVLAGVVAWENLIKAFPPTLLN